MTSERLPRDIRDRLWWLTFSPLVWALHFLASYITTAIWCAKFSESDGAATEVRLAVAAYTAFALALIILIGTISFRRHRTGTGVPPHDDPTLIDQRRFLGFAAFLLSCLSGIATVFTALVYLLVGSCH